VSADAEICAKEKWVDLSDYWVVRVPTDSSTHELKTKISRTRLTTLVDGQYPAETFVGEMPGTENTEEHLRQKLGIKRRAATASDDGDLLAPHKLANIFRAATSDFSAIPHNYITMSAPGPA
jgi:hypothetical protein